MPSLLPSLTYQLQRSTPVISFLPELSSSFLTAGALRKPAISVAVSSSQALCALRWTPELLLAVVAFFTFDVAEVPGAGVGPCAPRRHDDDRDEDKCESYWSLHLFILRFCIWIAWLRSQQTIRDLFSPPHSGSTYVLIQLPFEGRCRVLGDVSSRRRTGIGLTIRWA
jgi:hypothetical protein